MDCIAASRIGHPRQEEAGRHRLQARASANTAESRALFEKRFLVECFFHGLKRFRAIATRFQKTARNFLALTQVVCAWLWLAPN
jgi:transposase